MAKDIDDSIHSMDETDKPPVSP